jgi:phosphatidylserine/phosphatidylglycerophosphate/cardiolipin synthase-like enzyme
MLEQIRSMLAAAQRELLIINAYIIPTGRGIAALRELQRRGVDVKILTNSLASHDDPAVNSHYKQWRKPILEAGGELYEMRHDAEIQALVSDTPPTRAKFMGLHSKAMVADRERVYIGSMNYDPRSAQLNTEMGVKAVATLLETRPPLQEVFDKSVGYVVVDMTVTKIPWFGAGGGYGVVVNKLTNTRSYISVCGVTLDLRSCFKIPQLAQYGVINRL